MDNPLEQAAPTEPLERIHAFARDLAYGATKGLWGAKFVINYFHGESWNATAYLDGIDSDANFIPFLEAKWKDNNPASDLLQAFGYLTRLERRESGSEYYLLTSQAFQLLERPAQAPGVFISYRRETSSALALLVEARLKLRDPKINTFIDKLIEPGEDWAQRLQQTIRDSRYFICLLAPDTYAKSEWVRKELEIAHEADCRIITLFHQGARLDDTLPDWLRQRQIILVERETVKHYESALNELLVGLGYSTL